MPQARRKTPFSGKAKKQQLQDKKTNKSGAGTSANFLINRGNDREGFDNTVRNLNSQPVKSGRAQSNRYVLKFHCESEAELSLRKEEARHALKRLDARALEVDGSDVFPDELAFPVRPPWNFKMSRGELDARENKYFAEYVSEIERKFDWKELSYFELNLETWRQLWRVLELSDILLVIVDIRFPNIMFPPSLYKYVVDVLKKNMILVLNKIDLAAAPLVAAWKHYFTTKYPDLKIVYFTSCPGYNLRGSQQDKAGLLIRRRKGRVRMAAEGAQQLFDACNNIVGEQLDISSWKNKIKEEMEIESEESEIVIGEMIDLKNDTAYYDHVKYKDGILTIGCIGQPNVGKSSLMNAIMGKKVVSVSRTPGHTKHFQTIFLTPNVRLCDCPGLVFPSKVPKTLQVLMGSFPIAQLREPYSSIRYLSERLDLPKLLRMSHPEDDVEWSALDICDGWAKKRGFLTAKTGRFDSYRSANSLLRMTLEGRICLCLRPPGYSEKEEYWKSVDDVKHIAGVQAIKNDDVIEEADELSDDSDQQETTTRNVKKESSDSEEEPPSSSALNKFAALQSMDD